MSPRNSNAKNCHESGAPSGERRVYAYPRYDVNAVLDAAQQPREKELGKVAEVAGFSNGLTAISRFTYAM
jgi:hypothetical protein